MSTHHITIITIIIVIVRKIDTITIMIKKNITIIMVTICLRLFSDARTKCPY